MFRKPELLFLSSGIWTHNLKSRKTEMEHWAKKFSKTSPQSLLKTRLDTFGNDFGHFWNFEFFRFFLEIFENPTLQGTRGKKNFSKNLPQNMFKTRLHTFGNDFGHLWNFECFCFFWKFSKPRPSMEQWAKIIFPKESPKTRLDIWERFRTFLEI